MCLPAEDLQKTKQNMNARERLAAKGEGVRGRMKGMRKDNFKGEYYQKVLHTYMSKVTNEKTKLKKEHSSLLRRCVGHIIPCRSCILAGNLIGSDSC